MSRLVRRLARDPLLHFLAIGAVLFLIVGRGGGGPATDGEIIVSRADIDRIAAGFGATWQRPPSDNELQNAVADYVREEVLYRAGLDLGLDRDDTIVRRRIGQKMAFFLEDTVEPPTAAQLQDFLRRNPERYRTDPRFAFRQVFVSSQHQDALQEAQALLPKLVSAGPEAPTQGDPLLLPEAFGSTPLRDIAAQFGADFAKALSAARPGVWSGPIASAYGYHLVLVTGTEPSRLPELQEVRAPVERDWYAERRAAVLRAKYDELRSRYRVRIEDGSAP